MVKRDFPCGVSRKADGAGLPVGLARDASAASVGKQPTLRVRDVNAHYAEAARLALPDYTTFSYRKQSTFLLKNLEILPIPPENTSLCENLGRILPQHTQL